MAGDTPPSVPPTVDYAPLEEYEFDPLDELEPGNDFVDAALTRAGEFVLDVIETVQAHPVLTASVMAAGLGLLSGLVAAALAPKPRPSQAQRVAQAVDEAASGAAKAMSGRWARLRQARLTGRGLQELETAAVELPERGARLMRPWARHGAESAERLAHELHTMPKSSTSPLRRAGYAVQLGPVVLALLRNPLVRDLLIQLVLRQVRRGGRG